MIKLLPVGTLVRVKDAALKSSPSSIDPYVEPSNPYANLNKNLTE